MIVGANYLGCHRPRVEVTSPINRRMVFRTELRQFKNGLYHPVLKVSKPIKSILVFENGWKQSIYCTLCWLYGKHLRILVFCKGSSGKPRFPFALHAKFGKTNFWFPAYIAVVILDFLTFILQKKRTAYSFLHPRFQWFGIHDPSPVLLVRDALYESVARPNLGKPLK